MLSAEAYSFRHQARLAISLSWVGGFVNVVAFLAARQFVSHVTGNSTMIGVGLTEGDGVGIEFYCGLVGSFFLGSASSALMTEVGKRRGVASKYMLPLTVEAGLLAVLMVGLNGWRGGEGAVRAELLFAAAYAMGLQNATITKISGAVVRSTHLTGVVTDLGIEGVQFCLYLFDRLRGRWWERAGRVLRVSQRHPSALRVALLASIWGSFVTGATMGGAAYLHWHGWSLLAPILFLLGIVVQSKRARIADIREMDLLGDPELKLHGLVHSLLPPQLGIYRVTHDRRGGGRSPNFNLWIERIPEEKLAVILVLSPIIKFDSNAIMDLERAMNRLHERGRRLIVAGVNPVQYKKLAHEHLVERLGVENVCPDLEFAIALGVDVVREASRAGRQGRAVDG